MRVLVLHAHPVAESLNGAIHRLIVARLEAAGHGVDDCDLYAEGFEPRLSRAERLGYHDVPGNRDSVAPHVERLLAAEGLVICHPVWNYGYPAILKGFFDRVFLPGVTFRMVDGQVRPALSNVRRLAVVATYGGTRLRTMLMGDPPRRIAGRSLRATVKPGARYDYLALYDVNRADDRRRQRFLKRVGAAMDAF